MSEPPEPTEDAASAVVALPSVPMAETPETPDTPETTPPVKPERPHVWGSARASVTGFSNASIQQLAKEGSEPAVVSVPAAVSEPEPVPAPAAREKADVVPAPLLVTSTRPWAGNFSPVASQSSGLPDHLTQNITYGLRREANVMPRDWKPETAASAIAPVVVPLAGGERIEPEFVASQPFQEPATEIESLKDDAGAPANEVPVAPARHEAEPDHDDESADPPELTFEASRQHELDEETARELVARDEPAHEPSAEPEKPVEAEPEPEPEALPEHTPAVDNEVVTPLVGPLAEEPQADAKEPDQEPELEKEPAQEPIKEPEPAAASVEASEDEVGFMRAARRKAFWSKPSVRMLLGLIGVLLLAALAAQYAVVERNRLAVTHPPLRPLLEKLCEPLKCVVTAPRQIASIAIDSSTFTRVNDDPSAFRLQFVLKSNADIALEMPVLELTLTDSSDQPVLRRVLQRDETGAPAEFAAGGEWNGVVTLRVPEVADRVSGFKLLAFYP